ncbi:uncharacterized protein E0L32_003032 [Thyridium curvatum]|uniref:Nuclear pore complex protein n=1 Tax=Thyridium curvatum TaxID=1093900 RepID=A0A507BIY5_9PEZI|nr:uncharacterized protein E0L32_003032 [Thyridium curvatum]TPX17389.1 hypothetical protein E0L32_003032 [Thyridium curvatum]
MAPALEQADRKRPVQPGLPGYLHSTGSLGALVRQTSTDSEDGNQGISPDELAMLEDTYQQSSVQVGEEVESFARYLDDCLATRGSPTEQRSRIFRLVDNYYEYASDRAETLRERYRLKKAVRGMRDGQDANDMDVDEQDENSMSQQYADLKKWEEEAETWDLLRRLLPLRYRDKSAGSTSKRASSKVPHTRREYWLDFLESEPKAKEHKTILEWLQNNASKGPEIDELVKDLQRNAERGELLTHGWLHTRGAIKQHKRLVAASDALDPRSPDLVDSNLDKNGKIVTQLDPDVTSRQAGRNLAPEDAYFERALWLGCFELLRRGRSMSEIRDWCAERTEIWRAASMSALPLSSGDDEDVPNYDPYPTVLWRRMCHKLTRDRGTDRFERAVYGLLSGDITSVEAVSRTWDDFTFAKYNAELRGQFDAYLAKQCDPEAIQAMTMLHGDVAVFSDSRDREERNRKAANTPAKALQAAIIEDRLSTFLYQQGCKLADMANAKKESKLIPKYDTTASVPDSPRFVNLSDHDTLRILAHAHIIVSALERLEGKVATEVGLMAKRHQTEDHCIAAYASYLRLVHLQELIPLYSSRLIGERRYSNISRNIIGVDERDFQLRILNIMQRLGLDVVHFVKTQPLLYFSEVRDEPGVCPAKGKFKILEGTAPHLKYGRLIKPGIFGGDPDDPNLADPKDDHLIRSLEWLLLVDGLVLETCAYGVRLYKYFLKNQHLLAARILASRLSCSQLMSAKVGLGSPQEELDPNWWDETFGNTRPEIGERMDEDGFGEMGISKEQLANHARPLWELECLVNALDCLETTACGAASNRQDPSQNRDLTKAIDDNAKLMKGFMKPVLKDWLLESVEEDKDYQELRETYLPEVIIAYASTLQFAGTTTSRDYLLECMDLASVIADKDSDLAQLFVKSGRMKELIESFASCSKALAIWTSDVKKGGPGASSKKLREMGWSRELWSIKP